MSRRRKHPEHVNHERWLVSYADFITLLFAFFVVLYSSSRVDKHKVGQLSESIQNAFQELGVFDTSNTRVPTSGTEPVAFSQVAVGEDPAAGVPKVFLSPEMKDISADLEKALAPEIRDRVVEVTPTKEGLVVRLREIGFYESGEAVLRNSSLDAINRLAAVLASRTELIRFEGHTDNIPIHNAQFDSNWELSTARASNLIKIFIFRYRFRADRLSAAGYAEFHPITSDQTAEGRAQNRRIDIVILNPVAALPSGATVAGATPHLQAPLAQTTVAPPASVAPTPKPR